MYVDDQREPSSSNLEATQVVSSEDSPLKIELPDVESGIRFEQTRRTTQPQRRCLRLPRKRHTLVAVAVVIVLLLAFAGYVGVGGLRARSHLQRAAGLVSQMQQQVQRGDTKGAKAILVRFQQEIRAAHDTTNGTSWAVASHAPVVGDDIKAVRTLTAALDDLAMNGLPALIDVASSLESVLLSPKDGRIDLAAIQASIPKIATAAAALRKAQQQVATINADGLVAQLQKPVRQVQDGLTRAVQVLGPAEKSARLLPAMLGANGPRSYLVLFQNLAEVRATGGMPGAFIEISADHGLVKIVGQGTAAGTLDTFPAPVLPLDPDQQDLYTDRLGTFPADVNLTPDFPTAATLIREMYRLRTGHTVDAVMATDPVALSYLLKATGPIALPAGGPLTAESAVKRLLSDSYAQYPDPKQQDAFFAGAARAVFAALIAHKGDPRAMFSGLTRAASERRLLLWSSHPEEQADIAGTVLGGILPTDDGAHPTVGVFLNDGSGAKLSYYLTHKAQLSVGQCLEDGSVELKLKVTLGSTAPKSGLPAYVLGLGLSGAPYTVQTNLMVYSPAGGAVVGTMIDGQPVDAGFGVDRERAVGVVTVDLPPGTTKTVDVILMTPLLPKSDALLVPALRATPGVTPWPVVLTPGRGCLK